MRRSWILGAATALLVSGCSYGKPVESLSAACPLLAGPDAQLYLGEGIIAAEQSPDANGMGLGCKYQQGDKVVLTLDVQELPARNRTPAGMVVIEGRSMRSSSTEIDGLGDAAMYYEVRRRNLSMLAVAKRKGSTIRVMYISGDLSTSPHRLGALAAIALQHL
jgi:hypothetical protein